MTEAFISTFVLKPAMILLAAFLLCRVLKRGSAATRNAIWRWAVCGALILPTASLILPDLEFRVLPRESEAAHTSSDRLNAPLQTLSRSESSSLTGIESNDSLSSSHAVPSAGQAILLLWASGLALMMIHLLAGRIALHRIRRDSAAVSDGPLRETLHELSRHVGIRQTVQLRLSRRHRTPITWGILQPVITLPAVAADWDPERRPARDATGTGRGVPWDRGIHRTDAPDVVAPV